MRKVAVLLAALALAAGPALAGQSDRELLRDVASAVTRYVHFTIFDDVNASVEDGLVTLTGKVTMPFKRTEIEQQVGALRGVREVHNRIEVLGVSPFDDDLRHQVARAIYGNPSFWRYAAMANPPIHIIVDRGRVTLTGVVNNDVERMLARSLATSCGALSVTSELRTDAEMARSSRVLQ